MTLQERISALALAVRDKCNLMVPRLLPPGGTTGQLLRKKTANDYDTEWTAPGYPNTLAKKSANQSTAATALANITDLLASLAPNSSYRIKGSVMFMSAGLTVGARIGFNGPTGSVGLIGINVPVSGVTLSTAVSNRVAASSGSVMTSSVLAINTTLVADVEGIIHTGAAAGSFALQFAASGVAASITVLAGSTLFVEKIA